MLFFVFPYWEYGSMKSRCSKPERILVKADPPSFVFSAISLRVSPSFLSTRDLITDI